MKREDDQNKTKSQLLVEVEELRRRVGELEENEAKRIHTDAALRESEERYRSLVEHTSDAIFCYEYDPPIPTNIPSEEQVKRLYSGRLVECNIEAARYYGSEYPRDVLGKKLTELFNAKPGGPIDEMFSEFIRNKYRIVSGEGVEQLPDGSKRYFSNNAHGVIVDGTLVRVWGTYRDITERLRAEQAIQESEQRFSVLSAAAFEGIVISDKGRIVDINEQLAAMLGYERLEMINLTVEKFVAPESLELVLKHIRAGSEEPYEHLALRKDGSTFPVEIRAKSLPYKGRTIRVTAIRDITERKRAEEAVVESEERLRLFIEHAPASLAMFDREMRYLAVSRRWMTDYHLGDEEIIGRSHYDVFPEISDEWKAIYRRGLAGEVVRTDEDKFNRLDGSIQWLRWEVRPWNTAGGEVGGIVIFTEDITEHVLSAEALRRSEALLSEAQRIGRIGHWEWVAPGDEIICSDELFHIYEVPKVSNKISRNIVAEMIIPEDRKRVRQLDFNAFADRTELDYEFRIQLPDGRLRSLHQLANVTYGENGQPVRMIGIVQDITERKQVEEALSQRVDELSALYQTTLDIINSHNLVDLLNIIVTRAVDLLKGTSGGLYLCDPVHRRVRCVVSYKTEEDYAGTVLSYGEGAAGTVASTGEPLIIDNYRTWEGRAKVYEEDHPFSAVISVPMLWHGQVTGVIHVLRTTEDSKFTKENLTLLMSFANQAAVAVENTRLFEETQRRLERLTILQKIDEAITSSMDMRVTLNILIGHIMQQLEVDAAAVLLYQPELHSLEFVVGQGFHTQALQFTNLRLGQGFAGRAVLEQRTIVISDLDQMHTGFLRSPEFRNENFSAYMGVPLISKGNIVGVLEIYHRQALDPDPEWMTFLETLAGQAAIAIDNIRLFDDLQTSNMQLRQAYDATIEGWAKALELRDLETKGHSHRAVDLTIDLARKLGIEERKLTHIRWGALLHDIGKMGVPDAILQKPGQLNEEEWEIMRQHPVYAHNWLSPILYLQSAVDITYCHHEKWDGTGYPRGLKGEQIPLPARIFAIVDVWDALRSNRPYREAWSQTKVLDYLREQSGKHFDPQVLDAFIELLFEKGFLVGS